MIDTIVLDVKNVPCYKALVETLINENKTSYTEFSTSAPALDLATGAVEGGAVDAVQFSASSKLDYVRNYRLYNDSNNFVPVLHAQDIKVASWDYRINVHVNSDRIRFSFSIPKALYGTNVFQFCSFNHSIDELHRILLKYLKEFFSRFAVEIAFEDIEVRQLDLCYNQFFNSETDCFTYLDAQKKLVEQKSRINSKGFSVYKTSFQYLTQYYNFKVYHKGSEFKLHDAPRLQKLGKAVFAEKIQGYADRILRYEMSFKHSAFNMLFREYFFRGNQKHVSYELKKYVEKIMRLAQFLQSKEWDEYQSRTRAFTLRSDFDNISEPLLLSKVSTFPFNKAFIQLMQHYFIEKMFDYQVSGLPSFEVFLERIKDMNKTNHIVSNLTIKKRRINQRSYMRLIMGFTFLKSGHKFQDIASIVPAATLKDLKMDLKHLGISSSSADLEIPSPGFGWQGYELMCKDLGVSAFYL